MQSIRSTSLKSIVSLKAVISVIEVIFIILLAWLAASLFWLLVSGNTDQTETGSNPIVANTQSARSLNTSFDTLTQFDPFNRTISNAQQQIEQTAAPETSLDLKLFGVRQSLDENSAGSAIIRTPDQKEYVFTIDDEIIDGVKLVAIYSTYVEITRSGLRESLYLDGVDPTTTRTAAQRGSTAEANAPYLTKESGGTVRKSQINAFLKTVQMKPRRNGRFIDGWVINANSNQVDLLALGLKPNDIFLSVNDTPVTTLEILTELVSEIGNSPTLTIRVEREGKIKELSFDYQATQ
ncbi:type II secretion system protein N [Kordiimonas sp. SCSIO 12610]|uniref:type II secretion system protein N n=1 Tax=Kordiimonas sp. SCSIO 12610 TaxID=2829597 RepID=UPI00210D88A9|nr:type II secretion system protein N [Kordiimonas sp. SCSIO 12610]UTW56529.1 hypothetical protein KFF44_06410 [Kordiimonas sp. SCSIO 12610]